MCYEVSTDSTTVYYDFQHASWGHMFARSKDMIHWEKAPKALHEFTEWDYAYDGPAWLALGDKLYLYYRTFNVTTAAVEFKLKYKDVSDEYSGLSARIDSEEELIFTPDTQSARYKTVKRGLEAGYDLKAVGISLQKDGEKISPETPLTLSANIDGNSFFEGTLKVNVPHGLGIREIPYSYENGVLSFESDLSQPIYITFEPKIYGDANRDLLVTVSDALLILQNSVGKITFNERQTTLCDVDGDSAVTVTDALLVLQKTVNKISHF